MNKTKTRRSLSQFNLKQEAHEDEVDEDEIYDPMLVDIKQEEEEEDADFSFKEETFAPIPVTDLDGNALSFSNLPRFSQPFSYSLVQKAPASAVHTAKSKDKQPLSSEAAQQLLQKLPSSTSVLPIFSGGATADSGEEDPVVKHEDDDGSDLNEELDEDEMVPVRNVKPYVMPELPANTFVPIIEMDGVSVPFFGLPSSFLDQKTKKPLKLEIGQKKIPTCKVCEMTFETKPELKEHMKEHNKDITYECPVCQRVFGYLCSFKLHMNLHAGKKPYTCDRCGLSFSTKGNLQIHTRRRHNTERTYKCKECDEAFFQYHDLTHHRKLVHRGEKLHKCEICQKEIFSRNLSQHKLIHTNVRPYPCEFCERHFVFKNDLTKHMRTHTGEKPYSCKYCNKAFGQRNSMNTHMKNRVCTKKKKSDPASNESTSPTSTDKDEHPRQDAVNCGLDWSDYAGSAAKSDQNGSFDSAKDDDDMFSDEEQPGNIGKEGFQHPAPTKLVLPDAKQRLKEEPVTAPVPNSGTVVDLDPRDGTVDSTAPFLHRGYEERYSPVEGMHKPNQPVIASGLKTFMDDRSFFVNNIK